MTRSAEELRTIGKQLLAQNYHCLDCGRAFKFGVKGEPGVTVYTDAGVRELPITQVCESCFDGYFEGVEE